MRRTFRFLALLAVAVVFGASACSSGTRSVTGVPGRASVGSRSAGVFMGSAPAGTLTGPASAGAGFGSAPVTGFQPIRASQLPPEARATLRLIIQGGPFPYPHQDGVTFLNRERRLPAEPGGYYREFTVFTPGAADRGARRIITGKNGERYYTPDHYRSFMIVEGT